MAFVMASSEEILKLQQAMNGEVDLELAVLVGSRVDGNVHEKSDWDIAIQWKRDLSTLDNLANTKANIKPCFAASGYSITSTVFAACK